MKMTISLWAVIRESCVSYAVYGWRSLILSVRMQLTILPIRECVTLPA